MPTPWEADAEDCKFELSLQSKAKQHKGHASVPDREEQTDTHSTLKQTKTIKGGLAWRYMSVIPATQYLLPATEAKELQVLGPATAT